MSNDLVGRLRAWSRRYEPHSPDRRLLLEAASALEAQGSPAPAPPPVNGITADAVEAAMGGAKLLRWQRAKLEAPPSSSGG